MLETIVQWRISGILSQSHRCRIAFIIINTLERCYVICCDIIETVKQVQCWLRSWKDYYPFIQSTCMHSHTHTLTEASTKYLWSKRERFLQKSIMFSLRVLTFSRLLLDIQSRHSPASWSAWHLGVLGSQDTGVVRKSTYCSHRCTTPSALTDPLINQTSAVTDMTTAWMQSRLATDEGLKRAFFPALCLRASVVCKRVWKKHWLYERDNQSTFLRE